MKEVTLIALLLLATGCGGTAQKSDTASSPNPTSTEITATEIKALTDALDATENKLFNCSWNYWKDWEQRAGKRDLKKEAEISKECSAATAVELGEIYRKISKQPRVVERLLAEEMNEYYRNSAASIGSSLKTSMEKKMDDQENLLKSQNRLKRLMVLQNQRIIELLEKTDKR